MRHRLIAFVFAVHLTAFARAAPGQGLELHWPSITVDARLDADGRLFVREVQRMQFLGNWNGGQRIFNVGIGQKFSLRRLARIDSLTGDEIELREGDLSRVDGFDWLDEGTGVRWRSRLTTDPPFRRTEIEYVLEMEYGSILRARDDGTYLLDHDFAFATREGNIDRFTLTLTLAPAWHAPADFTGRYERALIPPGEGFVVRVPLEYRAAGRPEAVFHGTPASTRRVMAYVFVIAAVLLLLPVYRYERRLGRFAADIEPSDITPRFLDEHLFIHLPEVVGAAWDDRTSAPEVAAMLARMVQERKLSCRVETKGSWRKREVLHLTLEYDRDQFHSHEDALMKALFITGRNTTSTEEVREHYKQKGFEPASVVREQLEKLVGTMTRDAGAPAPGRRRTLGLLGLAVLCLVAGMIGRGSDAALTFSAIGVSLPLYVFGVSAAAVWRRRGSKLHLRALSFMLPIALMSWLLISVVLITPRVGATLPTHAGLVLWALMIVSSIANNARSRDSAERVLLRRRLTATRRFFQRELRKERPFLQDQWYPYLIAFGLARHMDRWLRAFGGSSTNTRMHVPHSGGSTGSGGGASASGSGGSGWSGFGGGGGFAGAGAGGSFASAVGGMAAAVPSPGGGGAGGGGGSSGGGGGGGW